MDVQSGSEPRRFREVTRPIAWREYYLLIVCATLCLPLCLLLCPVSWPYPDAALLAALVTVPPAAVLISRALIGRSYIELGSDGLRDVSRLGRCKTIPYDALRTVTVPWLDGEGAPNLELGAATGTLRLGGYLSGWPELLAELWRRQPALRVDLPGRLPARIRAIRDGVHLTTTAEVDDRGPFRYSLADWCCLSVLGVGFTSVGAAALTLSGSGRALDIAVALCVIAIVCAAGTIWDWKANRARVRVELRPDRLMFTDRSGHVHDIAWGEVVDYSVLRLPGIPGTVTQAHTRRETLLWPMLLPGGDSFEDTLIDALWKIDKELVARQS